MSGQTMASLAMDLVDEKLSKKRLRKMLRKERAKALLTQTQQDYELNQRRKQVRDLTDRLKRKCAQIAEQDEELLQLRTEKASLTDRLKRARCVCQGGSGVRRCKKLARLRKVTDDSD